MQNKLWVKFLGNRMVVREDDICELPIECKSGDLVELGNTVYVIRHYCPQYNALSVYTLTAEGALVYAYDVVGSWIQLQQWRLIRKLADCGLGNYPPEGCYPAWSDVWARWR